MSQLFESGSQSIGATASASGLSMNSQGWFPLGLTGLISLQSRDSQESSPAPQFKSINSSVLSLLYGPTLRSIQDYWKNHSFDYQFSSVTQSCLTLCEPMDCSMPGFPNQHQLLELAQTHVHHIGDAIQPSYYLSSPSPPACNISQQQDLFQWVSSSYQVAKAGASASTSVLPMNIQGWLPLGLTGLIRDSQESSPVAQFWKHQFFKPQLFLWSNSHMDMNKQYSREGEKQKTEVLGQEPAWPIDRIARRPA